ncbi:GNAT family N-acetyltransferase [Salinibacterium soli]|uniref:GNAT family N-acetyltransferase n=1 Tax=Antiquaquibacter soli TaxID=3064523 RepID=A0ABT9BMR0_9MICO|nr:GNAT family N-acetyltransferase [Protaetiibacter sp. WY-16]MDO7881707.1 GNAT family N-acetyltransferase [Protaetiibacter sp. WY-16]
MLERVFVITADWNPANVKGDAFWRADPTFDQYVGGFPRETDRGFVAEVNGEPVGMVWSRYFTADAPGYGFVSAGIPELGIGIVDGFRGRGIGRGLIETMIAATPGDLSLSVEDGNPAIGLYRSVGFEPVGRFGQATTMLRRAS